MDNGFHYCVLQTRIAKQWEVTKMLSEALPEGRGEIFYPCVELWMNGRESTVIKPLFPGYLFVRSDLGLTQLHELIRAHKPYVESFIKELHLSTRKATGDYGDYVEAADRSFTLIDLSDEEAQFLDFVLNMTAQDDKPHDALQKMPNDHRRSAPKEMSDGDRCNAIRGGSDTKPAGVPADPGVITRTNEFERLPQKGVFRMSYGYRENGNFVVMKGPLKGFEDHIVTADLRDHKAYLDIKINGHLTRVGLKITGKKDWFPDDAGAKEVLSDGREVDVEKLSRKMGGN
ncbi:MAG: hypothetical protein K6G81_09895 [Lachnospiraceae bacterium]|nr:hypothetical protein [Lachnospiraceae bacterium]